MGMWQEFKKFALKGNVIDLAVGVIIGASFAKITDSLVKDIIMPPIGLVVGKIDFSNLFINLGEQHYDTVAAAKAAGAPTLNYGNFLQAVLDFFILAFAIFIMVKQMTKLQLRADATKDCPACTKPIPIPAYRCPECTELLDKARA
ncbi:large conductance mechanosensitive channel protein MscL [Pendulispora albinea]|uniref:large conductance mechanosensitive channel protein MscL n=1 Tax=Pendulispora albinea TaxID=2741071 RepID=UPI00374E1B06